MSTASNSRDWSTLPDNVPCDQASGLPEPPQVSLARLTVTLERTIDFEAWIKSVTQTLKSYGLQNLIDLSVPRPKKLDPNADKWLHLSRTVQKWLEEAVSPELMRKIKASGKRVDLADEFVDQARRVFQGLEVNTDMEKIVTLLSIRRSDFARTDDFVCRFRDKYLEVHEGGIGITPYLAVLMLLEQLEKDDRHVVTSIIATIYSKTVDKDRWRIFKPWDFQKVCEKTLDLLKKVDTPATGLAAPHVPDTFDKLIDVSAHSSDMKTHCPAPGISPEQHVKAWCERQPQMNDMGQCTYCMYPFHGPARCFYLNPYLRPLDWKPQDTMWIFKPELNSGRRQWTKPITSDGSGNGIFESLLSQHDKEAVVTSPLPKKEEEKDGTLGKMQILRECLPLIDGPRFTASRHDWEIVTNFNHHIAADRTLLVEYRVYGPGDTVFEWAWHTGRREKALGTGKARIPLKLPDGSVKEIIIDCFYQPRCPFSIFSVVQAAKTLGVNFDRESLTLFHFPGGELKVFGSAVVENELPFLRTVTFDPKKGTEHTGAK
ncbi:hypothetical protein N7492_004549 [Penicillium capsulatum]|uniref:Uncharacterized protein n=1 Tax=Penicillium capsulatum TaxID=69766 RepID=A0A9W9LQV2_9EURO|nr:hypothetical protein N7492_004549 [Penicillium capsulatum]KAJ6136333.1 hypothetical protein N7512_001493 [Penicillium capsulatum]